jgi:hypothetical protein
MLLQYFIFSDYHKILMISIIICSVNETLLTQVKKNIQNTIGVEHEVVAIDNLVKKYSLTHAYNEGAAQAKYPYLCFLHEDILFHTQNWGQLLIDHLSEKSISLVGILGCLVKTQSPSGVYIPIGHLNRVNQLQRRKDDGTDHYIENPFNETYSQVATVDGMFLAVTRQNHSNYPFDEHTLTGFHAYDIDYSLGQAKNGKIAVVYDILIEHFSYGGNTRQWIDAQLLVTKKWANQLPLHIHLSTAELKQAEIINMETFLIALYTNRYKKLLQLKYLFKLLVLRPFNSKNFALVAKLIVIW